MATVSKLFLAQNPTFVWTTFVWTTFIPPAPLFRCSPTGTLVPNLVLALSPVGRHDDDDDDDGDDDDGPPLLQPKAYIDILALSASGSTQLVHWHTSSHV